MHALLPYSMSPYRPRSTPHNFLPIPAMSYQLASSSTEEGEVRGPDFPYHKSFLQYYYYPRTSLYIGRNSLPSASDYLSEAPCSKLLKDLRADYPYIPFALPDTSRQFFDNRFVYVRDMELPSPDVECSIPMLSPIYTFADQYQFKLKHVQSNHKTVQRLQAGVPPAGTYDRYYHKVFFSKEEQLAAPTSPGITTHVIIEDRMLKALGNPDAFIFCRVIEGNGGVSDVATDGSRSDRISDVASHVSTASTRVLFEDVFYSRVPFYDYLDLCADQMISTFNSTEVRVYENSSTQLTVFSATTFVYDSILRRLHPTVDEPGNIQVVFNRDGPAVHAVSEPPTENIHWLTALDIPEGDYVINNKKIYKIGTDGLKIDYRDIDYSDFFAGGTGQ